jgi:hypothetical protein
MVKSTKELPKNIREPHFAASFGYISCGSKLTIITIKPKFATPYAQLKTKNKKKLLFKLLEKRPPIFIIRIIPELIAVH